MCIRHLFTCVTVVYYSATVVYLHYASFGGSENNLANLNAAAQFSGKEKKRNRTNQCMRSSRHPVLERERERERERESERELY